MIIDEFFFLNQVERRSEDAPDEFHRGHSEEEQSEEDAAQPRPFRFR